MFCVSLSFFNICLVLYFVIWMLLLDRFGSFLLLMEFLVDFDLVVLVLYMIVVIFLVWFWFLIVNEMLMNKVVEMFLLFIVGFELFVVFGVGGGCLCFECLFWGDIFCWFFILFWVDIRIFLLFFGGDWWDEYLFWVFYEFVFFIGGNIV